jgi:putative Mg2+ transporter-C (MgtC) family protein
MDFVWSELGISMRLVVAALLAGLIGWERERGGHQAGLRTHILVGLGAALFTLVPAFQGQVSDYSNVVKGVAAGIGFLGGGAILKDVQKQSVEGLTTAASIWLTAAVGLASAAGMYLAAVASTVIALIVLWPMQKVESPSERDAKFEGSKDAP